MPRKADSEVARLARFIVLRHARNIAPEILIDYITGRRAMRVMSLAFRYNDEIPFRETLSPRCYPSFDEAAAFQKFDRLEKWKIQREQMTC